MHLLLSADSPLQTTLFNANQRKQIVYAIQSEASKSSIMRYDTGDSGLSSEPRLVGEIEFLGDSRSCIMVHGREVQMEVQTSLFTRTLRFSTSDGMKYKWKTKYDGVKLFTGDAQASKVARFYESSPGSSAVLSIPDEVEVGEFVDAIVTTCCYAEEERRTRVDSRHQRSLTGTDVVTSAMMPSTSVPSW